MQRTSSNDAYASNTAYAVNRNYSVNGLNQYTAAGSATFQYDANGNLTSDGATTFTYDVENRLVAAGGARSAQLRYDPLGRLYKVSGGSGTTRFLYDGDALIGEYDLAGTMTARYGHGANPGADDPLVWFGGGLIRFLHTDHQGSIVAVTNGSGGLGAINAYDAWGIPNSTNVGRFQYTGQAWIPELGMYHYKARVYSPTLGRFLQTDPVGYEDQMNLYSYVGNDPVNHTDPTGMRTFDCRGGVGGASCPGGTAVRTGDRVITRFGNFSLRRGQGFTLARPIVRGSEGRLSPRQVQNIVFNETRSLRGPTVDYARRNMAHAIMNGDEERGARRPRTHSTTANPPAVERGTYYGSGRMVLRAMAERSVGYDPTEGAQHFNLRPNPSMSNFQGARLTTQVGPLNNSFPTQGLPSSGIYVNTYRAPEDDD